MSGSTFSDALEQARQLHRRASLRDMRSRYAINWYVAGLGLATREARRDRQAYESAARENGVKLNKNSRENPAIGLAKIAAGDPSLKVPHWTHAAAYLAVPPNGDPPPETLRAAYSYIGLRGGVESLYKLWAAHKRPPDETNDGPPSFTTQWADDALDGIPSDFLAEFEDHEADRYVLALIRLGDSEGVCHGYVLEEADELELLRIVRRIKRRPVGEDGALSYDARQRTAREQKERTSSTTEQVQQVVERIKSKMTEQRTVVAEDPPAAGEEPAPEPAPGKELAVAAGEEPAPTVATTGCYKWYYEYPEGWSYGFSADADDAFRDMLQHAKAAGREHLELPSSLDDMPEDSDGDRNWILSGQAICNIRYQNIAVSYIGTSEDTLDQRYLAIQQGWLRKDEGSPYQWFCCLKNGKEAQGYTWTWEPGVREIWKRFYPRKKFDFHSVQKLNDDERHWYVLSLDDWETEEDYAGVWQEARELLADDTPTSPKELSTLDTDTDTDTEPVKQPPMEGTCSVCARQIRLTTAGTVRSHIIYGTNGRRCKGGGWPPAKQRRANSIDAWEPVGESEDAEA